MPATDGVASRLGGSPPHAPTTTREPASRPPPPEGATGYGTRPHALSGRLRPLSLTGTTAAVVFACLSLTPSLVPRSWVVQGLLAGLCATSGYALGGFVGWAVPALGLPQPGGIWRARLWRVLAVATPLLVVGSAILGRHWQQMQRALLGMPEHVPLGWVLSPLLGALVLVVLLMVGRGIVWATRRLFDVLLRYLPRRLAMLTAMALSATAVYVLVTGVVAASVGQALGESFAAANAGTGPGVARPASGLRSGGPGSSIEWSSLGREGRQFVAQGPDAATITAVTGVAAAREPIRVYVGLASARTPEARAVLAVRELERTGGLDRRVVAVAAGTGTGWIDPAAAAALEYVSHGDSATVTVQYSYLPSWLSFLVDRDAAVRTSEELVTAVRARLARMPEQRRPRLVVYGESLGAFATDSAFTSVDDIMSTTGGALLIGPPHFDPVWTRLVVQRRGGTPVWRPVSDDPDVQVAAAPTDLTASAGGRHSPSRVVYLVHPSDPVVAWSPSLLWRSGAWLAPRGADVSPDVHWMPVVGFWQTTADLFTATAMPVGHGHVYGALAVDAWAQVLPDPRRPAGEIARIRAAVARIGTDGSEQLLPAPPG